MPPLPPLPPETPTARSRPRRWRTLLAWTAAVAVALLLIGAAGQWAAAREASFQADSIRRAMEVHALGLRDAAGKYGYLPRTAGMHPDVFDVLAHPRDPTAQQRANRYIEEVNRHAGSDALYLIDLQGLTLAASNWATPQSFVGESYANRPYFIDARAGRSGLFYGVGQTTGEPGLFMSAPVRSEAGAVLGVLTVKISLRQLQEAWTFAREPILLTDARGIVFLSSVPAWMYQATRPLAAADLDRMKREQQYGDRTGFSPLPWTVEREEGHPGYLVRTDIGGKARRFLALDEPLPDLGWTLTVMADHAEVDRARERTWMLGLLCAGVLLLGGLYWQLRERRFAEQRDARRDLELRVRERTHALDEAHAFRKAMEDSLLVGMRARDLEGRIIYVNPAFCEMTGYGADELLGRLPPYPYWHPDDVAQHWLHYQAMMSGQPARSGFESRLQHRDGHEVITMVYTAPLIDADGRHSGWMSSVVDITEQKRAELRQRQNDEQLQHAQRLASLGEMASTLAHELNQPLMALSNFASAAKAFAEQGNQQLLASSLDETVAQARRSAEIVRRIRGFVRQRTAGTEDCAVAALVTNALALLQGEMRLRQARAEVRIAPSLPPVRGDRVLLEQVLLNLLSNSLHAMLATPPEERVMEVEAELLEGRVHIRVADRGSGIDAALAEQVFAPFFTTKAGGLGLGLNICRTIVEAHRGRLSFANRAGGGTVFTLELEISAP
ncbi:sensor histidine kinase [Variovorax paradoxus]|jgi:two-component system sensor histidine kinase DctS|uniref:sensor histidine kinase n=1 Tax=Variovorax paradoxus TaxID=34073 RepID=UPI0029C6E4EB|nr:PAS domain S-box protein [Variovorax paradoxus]WPH19355.1 PAS domain S-box protein [Variovorax paradoxus]